MILSLNLHVAVAPWKSWWAYTIYGLLLLGMVVSVIYLRTRLQQTEYKTKALCSNTRAAGI